MQHTVQQPIFISLGGKIKGFNKKSASSTGDLRLHQLDAFLTALSDAAGANQPGFGDLIRILKNKAKLKNPVLKVSCIPDKNNIKYQFELEERTE
jgi:hypothetical protein